MAAKKITRSVNVPADVHRMAYSTAVSIGQTLQAFTKNALERHCTMVIEEQCKACADAMEVDYPHIPKAQPKVQK
jgi:hypothetical protein